MSRSTWSSTSTHSSPPTEATPPGQHLYCQCLPRGDLEIAPAAWHRIDPKARKFLVEEMEKFFFGGGSQKPQEFVEPEK